MEMWALALVLLIAALGVLGMLGYTKNETEKLELKHMLATEQFRREMSELEDKFSSEESERVDTIKGLTLKVEELEHENEKIQASLERLRKQDEARASSAALSAVPAAEAV
jgi:type I site-specific restriction endonuclease